MPLTIKIFFGFTLALMCCANSVFAQPSIIEVLQGLMPSIVEITAENAGAISNPRTAVAIDKATGRLVVLRNIKTAYYKRKGAGVIIDPSGIIVTNFHTINNSNRITIALNDNSEFPATVLKTWPAEDLVLLKIDASNRLVTVEFINSDLLQLGQEVFTVACSQFFNHSIYQIKIFLLLFL